jgi:pimeloyl-ACP methyl ester carboxylesterase
MGVSKIVFFLCALVVLFLAGPRARVHFRSVAIDFLPEQDIVTYLLHREASYPAVIPGTEKSVSWAAAPGEKTSVSIVYLHGFSSSRQDTFPLCERLAEEWGANVFYTRLRGHGLGGESLASARVEDFLQDTLEALAVGRRIGEKVIVIGNSSGGALAAWLATLEGNDDVLAYVLLSPALGFRHPLSGLLSGPWGAQIARLVVGPQYSRVSDNPLINRYWTTQYPSGALVTPGLLAAFARQAAWEKIHRPLLVIYSPEDRLVDPGPASRAFKRIPRDDKKLVAVRSFDHSENHVLAGDLRAPQGTDTVAKIISGFIKLGRH